MARNFIIPDGLELKLYGSGNTYNGSIKENGQTLELTGAGSHVHIKTGNNLVFDGATATIQGTSSVLTIGATGDTVTIAVDTTITGDLTINGTTTTINATTLTIDDKNIELGSVASPTDTTADGGGITLRGATDKTILWDNANDNWTSSDNWNLASGKCFKINNVPVLTATNLCNSVTSSCLTTIGSITSGCWHGSTIDVDHGGTGATSFTVNAILTGNTTSALQVPGPTLSSTTLTFAGAATYASTTAATNVSIHDTNTGIVSMGSVATTVNVACSNICQTINIGANSQCCQYINIGSGATAASCTKSINIGTGGAANSITCINIGNSTGNSLTTVNGCLKALCYFGSGAQLCQIIGTGPGLAIVSCCLCACVATASTVGVVYIGPGIALASTGCISACLACPGIGLSLSGCTLSTCLATASCAGIMIASSGLCMIAGTCCVAVCCAANIGAVVTACHTHSCSYCFCADAVCGNCLYDGGNRVYSTVGLGLCASGCKVGACAVSTNTANTLVLRDNCGNFYACCICGCILYSGGSAVCTSYGVAGCGGTFGIITIGSGLCCSAGCIATCLAAAGVGCGLQISSGCLCVTSIVTLFCNDKTGTGCFAFNTSPAFVTSVTGGASFDVFNTVSTSINAFGAATTLCIGNGTCILTIACSNVCQTINIGANSTSCQFINIGCAATVSGCCKLINLGTGGAIGGLTFINLGSATVGSLNLITTNGCFTQTSIATTGTAKCLIANCISTGCVFTMTANCLSTGNALDISSTSTVGAGFALINLSKSGANATSGTTYGLKSYVYGAGTTTTNVAGYFRACGGTTCNWAIQSFGDVQLNDTACCIGFKLNYDNTYKTLNFVFVGT